MQTPVGVLGFSTLSLLKKLTFREALVGRKQGLADMKGQVVVVLRGRLTFGLRGILAAPGVRACWAEAVALHRII